MDEAWHVFRIDNAQVLYGYGTKEDAYKYADILNKDKADNLYATYALGNEEARELGLEYNKDAFNIHDKITTSDI
jgi:hypothetical protein